MIIMRAAKKASASYYRLNKRLELRQQPRWRRKRWLVILVVLVAVGIVAHVLSTPAQGRSIPVDLKLTRVPAANAPPTTPQAAASTVRTAYFSLPLPPGYAQQDASTTIAGRLYNLTVIKQSLSGSLIINIAVSDLPAGGLAGDSDYQLYSQSPGHYQLNSQAVKGDKLMIASDVQLGGVVVFWPHGNYLATMGVSSDLGNSSPDDNADELAAVQPLLQAWQWQ
jgi:hypothetical protein